MIYGVSCSDVGLWGKIFVLTFRAGCIITAFFVILKQFEIYRRCSEKVETISFRRFGMRQDDYYPSISYCFSIEDRNSSFDEIQDLEKTLLGEHLQDGILLNKITFTVKNSFGGFETMNWFSLDNGDLVQSSSGTEMVDETYTGFPFIRKIEWMQNYDSAGLCYTRSNNHVSTKTRVHDTIIVNLSTISDRDATVNVYLHHPGQLMRSLESPIYVNRREHLCWDNEWSQVNSTHATGLCYSSYGVQDVKMNYISVMRLDPHAGEWRPCDQKLADEDQEKKRYVLKELGCVPNFWNISLMNSDVESRPCESKHFELFKKLHQDLKFSDEHPGINLYRKSCNRMTVLHDITYTDVRFLADSPKMEMKFLYPPQGKRYIVI